MNVLHVIPSVAPSRGGASLALSLMVTELARAGVQVDVATTDDDGIGRASVPLEQPILREGVTTRYFRRQTRFYTASWPITRWLAAHVREYDLLHIHALFSYSSTAAALIARRHGVPYVLEPLGTLNHWGMRHRRRWLKRASFGSIERHIVSGAAAVHFTSDKEQCEAAALGVPYTGAVIPLGIDMAPLRELPPPERFLRIYPELRDRTLLLFLSRLDPKKGLDLLLHAFTQVRRLHPGAALVLAGSGDAPFVADLRREATRLGIAADVVWPGFLQGEDKLAAFSAASLFVLPSYSENFGLAAIEAMAAGVPVALSDQLGFSSEVQRAEAGLVVPCEPGALAAALQCLVADTALRRRLGERGRQLVRDRFSSEATTRELLALYERVIP